MIAMPSTFNKHQINLLPIRRKKDYEFIFEDYELAFPKVQLAKIALDWNNGKSIDQIAKEQRRHEVEVLLALIHLANKRRITRPFAFRVDDIEEESE